MFIPNRQYLDFGVEKHYRTIPAVGKFLPSSLKDSLLEEALERKLIKKQMTWLSACNAFF